MKSKRTIEKKNSRVNLLAVYAALTKTLGYLADTEVEEILLNNDCKLWISRKEKGFTEFMVLTKIEFATLIEALVMYRLKVKPMKMKNVISSYIPFGEAQKELLKCDENKKIIKISKTKQMPFKVTMSNRLSLIESIANFQKSYAKDKPLTIEGYLPIYKELQGQRFTIVFSKSYQSPSVMFSRKDIID